MVMLDGVILGGLGGALYIYMTYSIWQILQNIREDEETALTKLLIDKDARKAFKILSASTLLITAIFSGRIILESLNMALDESPLIIVLPLPLAGIAYFFHKIMHITEKNSSKESAS